MSILNKLFLRQFLPLFVLALIIAQFVLLMQFLWKYVDDMIGKGLEAHVVAELLFYASAYTVPLAIPIAVLISSIMTLGSLAEHNELVALKSSGISLVRSMRPLFVFSLLISFGAFLFSNYYLPYANLKFGALLYDVRQKRPALNIQEGVFYDEIEGISIRINDKDPDGVTLRDILIYDHSAGRGNDNVLMADSGQMFLSDNSQFLVLKLYEGDQYQEVPPKSKSKSKYEHLHIHFQEWEKIYDLASFQLNRTDESFFKDEVAMLNIAQLSKAVDSLQLSMGRRTITLSEHIKPYFYFLRTGVNNIPDVKSDTPITGRFLASIDPSKKHIVMSRALDVSRTVKQFILFADRDIQIKKKMIIKHRIEWHKKFTWSIACFILFLIGAPFGAIIRKGGFGWPMVWAILFFCFYFIIAMIGEKSAKVESLSMITGMWLTVIISLPIGIILTWKANHDTISIRNINLKKLFARFLYFKKPKP